jgi:hypothetical protein
MILKEVRYKVWNKIWRKVENEARQTIQGKVIHELWNEVEDAVEYSHYIADTVEDKIRNSTIT